MPSSILSKLTLSLLLLVFVSPGVAQERATSYEELFLRSTGWTGADGTYSIPLGAGKTLWGFSDTFFGEVENGLRVQPYEFVNNSLVTEQNGQLFFWEAPSFEPPDRQGWFWLFDGIAQSQTQVEILLGQFHATKGGGAFGFAQSGLWWARFELPSEGDQLTVSEYRRLPYFWENEKELVTFGSALLEAQDWLYAYGIKQEGFSRSCILARIPKGKLGDASQWSFHDGKTWNSDPQSVKPLFTEASVEYSVHEAASGFVYIACADNGMSNRVIARHAPTPEGPWSDPVEVAVLPEHQSDVFCYNAKAHPELTRDGKILVSYNVNSTDLKRVELEADIYRPRFLWWTPPTTNWLPRSTSAKI